MTRDEIMQMESGKKMDKLIAKKVMAGWSDFYSFNIAAAWKVVERIKEFGEFKTLWVQITSPYAWKGPWKVEIYEGSVSLAYVENKNICLAICRAALLAVMGDEG